MSPMSNSKGFQYFSSQGPHLHAQKFPYFWDSILCHGPFFLSFPIFCSQSSSREAVTLKIRNTQIYTRMLMEGKA